MRGLFVMNVNFYVLFMVRGWGSIITGKLFIQDLIIIASGESNLHPKHSLLCLGLALVNFLVLGKILPNGNSQRKNIFSGKGIIFLLLVFSM